MTGVLRATPEPWQAEALKLIGKHNRIAIRSGHGVGKTAFLSWITLWFLTTRRPCKIPITANSQDQLRDIVWPEIKKWAGRLPTELRTQIDSTSEKIFLDAGPSECFAVARTASKDRPEALQGFHEDNLLFVLEEASGIPDEVFEVAQGALSTPGAKILMVGNPTRTSGYFFDAFHSMRDRWQTMQVSSIDVPRARGHIEDVEAKYGKDSNVYKVRVLGEFPESEEDVVIPLHLIESAVHRQIEPSEAFRMVWGLDVARFGDDRCALAKRRGNVMPDPIKSWRNRDTMQTSGMIMKEYNESKEEDRPNEILVDVIGLGAGVVDRLKELGLPARGVNVAERPALDEQYMRLRDELWFKMRDWFEARDCKMADDPGLIAELADVKYDITSSGKLQVESKDAMKERIARSPDLADALMLTFAGGMERVEEHTKTRYKFSNDKHASWLTQ